MKKKNVFAVGDRVAHAVFVDYGDYGDGDEDSKPEYRYDPDVDPQYGTVTSILEADKQATVKWDNQWYAKYNDAPIDFTELMHEESFKKLHTKLEEKYNTAEKEIVQKMKQAGKLVKEANKLAKKLTGRELSDMYEAISPLVDAMDSSGWRSSSWGC